MSSQASDLEDQIGVVTFLDVLGWKGVYNRQDDAIASLAFLVEGIEKRAPQISRGRIRESVEIKSISDTIVLFSQCADEEIASAIEIHGELCQWLIPNSIEREIPVRGATSYGEYKTHANIYVGKAVDEAAAWHEKSDWIGVHLTPSAEYLFNPNGSSSVWAPYKVPHKTKIEWKPHCVNWWGDYKAAFGNIDSLKVRFRSLGPILPEVTPKFANTLCFVEHIEDATNPESV